MAAFPLAITESPDDSPDRMPVDDALIASLKGGFASHLIVTASMGERLMDHFRG